MRLRAHIQFRQRSFFVYLRWLLLKPFPCPPATTGIPLWKASLPVFCFALLLIGSVRFYSAFCIFSICRKEKTPKCRQSLLHALETHRRSGNKNLFPCSPSPLIHFYTRNQYSLYLAIIHYYIPHTFIFWMKNNFVSSFIKSFQSGIFTYKSNDDFPFICVVLLT